MRKPTYQWETPTGRARREDALPPGWEGHARAESFVLEYSGGRTGRATFAVDRQEVDGVAMGDPGISLAAKCWVAARGGRALWLSGPSGAIDEGSFSVAALAPPGTSHARRIITLAPSNAEIVDALGAFERVIACEDSSDHPPAVASLERLGPDLGPDLDRVAELSPDLVLSSLSVPGMERVVTGLAVRGVPQLVLAPRSLADVRADIRRTAQALGLGGVGEAVVRDMEAQEAELRAACSGEPTPVYLEWWPKPMFTPGQDCYSNELISLAGGRNVFGDRPGSSLEVQAADIVAADPAVCFVSWCGVAEEKLDPQNLIQRCGLEGLPAAQQGRVFRLDEAFSGRPGPRMLEAARRMAAAIRAT